VKKSIKLMVLACGSLIAMNASAGMRLMNVSSYAISIVRPNEQVIDIPKKTMVELADNYLQVGNVVKIYAKAYTKTITGMLKSDGEKVEVFTRVRGKNKKMDWAKLPISKDQKLNPVSLTVAQPVIQIDVGTQSPENGISVQIVGYDSIYDTKKQGFKSDLTKKYGEIYSKRLQSPRPIKDEELHAWNDID